MWPPVPSFERIFRRKACCAWVALFLAAGVRAQVPDVTGTMPEDRFPVLRKLLESALRQSPGALEKQLEIAVHEARIYGADARRLPQLGASGSFDQSQSAVSGSNSRRNRDSGLFYNVEASQAVFHWGALKNESARARVGVAMAGKNYQEALRLVTVDLRRQFLLLIAKKAALVQQRDRQRLRAAELKLAQEKFSEGLVAESEVTGRRLAFEEGGVDLARDEAEFAALRRGLARIAAVPDLPEDDVPADLPDPRLPLDLAAQVLHTLLRDGAKHTYQVQLQELEARQAELSYRIAKVRLLPKFSTSIGHRVENTTNVASGNVDQQGIERQAVSLRADWPIFDGFAAKGATQEALATKRVAEQRRTAAADSIMEQAQVLQRQLGVEIEALRMVDRRRALADSELRRVKEEVERGNARRNLIEEKNSQVLLSHAASAVQRANLLTLWSQFISIAGADPLLKTVPVSHAR